MNPIIGVIVDTEKIMTSINNADSYYLYQKVGTTWVLTREITYSATSMTSITQTRQYIKELCHLLGECKILVGTEILGLPFHLLDAHGFLLCEAKEYDYELLSTILVDYLKDHKKEDEKNCNTSDSDIHIMTPSSPVPTDSYGCYYLDLDLTLKSHPSLSSKKILLPFFEKTLFDSLTVDCSHVMPWLDTMLPSCLSYRYDTVEDGRKRIEIFANS